MDIERPPDIVVIAGGAPVAPALVSSVGPATAVVAADAGVGLATDLGWRVDVAVGDFDSLDPDRLADLDRTAGEVRRFPVAKDATDIELALHVAAERAPARVLVAGVEGGRPDHALANLLVASSAAFSGLEVELALEGGRAWVVRDRLTGALAAGATISVVPVHGDATVSVGGVQWPLDHEVLPSGSTRGISNRSTGEPFTLAVHAGAVLCIAPNPEEPRP